VVLQAGRLAAGRVSIAAMTSWTRARSGDTMGVKSGLTRPTEAAAKLGCGSVLSRISLSSMRR